MPPTSPGEDAVELGARGDAELAEDLPEVVLDGVCADEQAGADLGVRQPVAGQPGYLSLLGGQFLMPGGKGPFVGGVPVVRSSRLARSANATTPIASSMAWAVRSCSRASLRRRSRRSHSSYSGCAGEIDAGARPGGRGRCGRGPDPSSARRGPDGRRRVARGHRSGHNGRKTAPGYSPEGRFRW
jgi:hypothetical protein